MLIGLAGCGKTQSCTGLLKKLNPEACRAPDRCWGWRLHVGVHQPVSRVLLLRYKWLRWGPTTVVVWVFSFARKQICPSRYPIILPTSHAACAMGDSNGVPSSVRPGLHGIQDEHELLHWLCHASDHDGNSIRKESRETLCATREAADDLLHWWLEHASPRQVQHAISHWANQAKAGLQPLVRPRQDSSEGAGIGRVVG